MKKMILATVLAGVSSVAFANVLGDGLYVQGNVGYAKLQTKEGNQKLKDNSTSFGVAFGKDTGNVRYAVDYTNFGTLEQKQTVVFDADMRNLVADITRQVTGRSVFISSAKANVVTKVKAQSLGMSAIYDFANNSAFTPYAGLRVGVNQLKADVAVTTDMVINGVASSNTQKANKAKSTKVGAGVVAGVQYAINPQLAVDAGVEYNYLGKFDKIKADQYGAKVGLRYNF
ncbi:Opacity protein [Moraxella cuniculi DSM 21768]|uniref:Opacity protein n=1 Tax=Moraxella cuniculi DSM 21768 TaxID=1122245 RepID=A0A1N7FR36_9GAMM|nr:opacity family porin [Moraxella cuniculi]OOS08384.1 hypothetical protein B0189_00250 [Moraxella cuniculi]SIS02757.1 Opacity protein [Moraxella cuniculi DSM 21768]